jgi:hypothetical protein
VCLLVVQSRQMHGNSPQTPVPHRFPDQLGSRCDVQLSATYKQKASMKTSDVSARFEQRVFLSCAMPVLF